MISIEYSVDAIVDVENIFQTILEDKPSVAGKYITKLEKFIDLLAFNKKMGVECKKRDISFDCRVVIFEQYKIFYQINLDEIYIVRIIHSKQSIQNRKF